MINSDRRKKFPSNPPFRNSLMVDYLVLTVIVLLVGAEITMSHVLKFIIVLTHTFIYAC